MDLSPSLFERWISRPRYPWANLAIGVIFLLIPIVIVSLRGEWDSYFSQGNWRGYFIAPTMILYILLVSPRLEHMDTQIIDNLRPVILLDDDSFSRIVRQASYIKPSQECIAIGIGSLVGIISSPWVRDIPNLWLKLYALLSVILQFGLLAWIIFVALAGTRLTTTLLRQPMTIDPFDITPFETIGRQSLLLALVFIGGITLSLILAAFKPENLLLIEFWLSYLPIALVPVMIFFLNMRPTHRVLAAAKRHELKAVQGHLRHAFRNLTACLDASQEAGSLASEINALATYEGHLQATRTWPYNTSMLRTLFFSVFIPLGTALLRVILAP